MTVQSIRWDQVAVEDKIQNPATKSWHEVTSTVLSTDGALVKVWIKGQATALKPRPATGLVDVQRGEMGAVVDLFQVIFSGRTAPEH